jgi:type I restriction enzyme S subunit
MSEWKTYRLSELIHLVGGGTPKTTVAEYWNGEIPWLSVVDFGKGIKKVYKTEKSITRKGLNESSTKILKEGQIIISARGTVGELAVLGRDMAFNQSCYGIYANEKTENNFLYYLLKYSIGKIKKNTHGAVFDTITKQTFDNIEVSIPENKATQRQIAQILSSLDDKIELNLQMNQTLEAMAQAIFKEWFVNFNFPGFDGELVDGLPKGWRKITLDEIAKVKNGFAFKGTDFINEGIPVIKIKNIKPNKILLNDLSYVSREVADKAIKYRINQDDILITMSGNRMNGTPDTWVGKVALFQRQGEYLLNQRVSVIDLTPDYSHLKYYLTILLSSIEFQNYFISIATSSGGQANISPALIYSTEIILPDLETSQKFYLNIKSFYDKILENELQIESLTQTRDTLLPKLMSGQLEVV